MRLIKSKYANVTGILFIVIWVQAFGPAFSSAQERTAVASPAQSTSAQSKPAEAREPYPLRNRGDISAAINLVKPLAESEKADISTLIFLCSLYEDTQDFKSAADWYRRIMAKAGKEVNNLPWNVHGLRGTSLFKADQDEEAIPELELGLQHYSYSQDDPAIYRMLAIAYQKTGAFREARQAHLSTLSVLPSIDIVWSLLKYVNSKTPNEQGKESLRPGVPRPPTTKSFSDLIDLGNSSEWSIDTLRKGIPIYMQYAEYLDQRDRRQASERVRRTAIVAAGRLGAESFDQEKYEDCIQALSMIERVKPIGGLEPEFQQAIYRLLARAYAELEQYVPGVVAAEQFLGLIESDKERREESKLLDFLLLQIYYSVSWNKLGELRENDPDDFVGHLVPLNRLEATAKEGHVEIPARERHAEIKRQSRHSSPPKKGSKLPKGLLIPYGMVSRDEDYATLGTVPIEEELGVRIAGLTLLELVRLRIIQQNFELPVKVFLMNIEEANSEYRRGEKLNINEQFVRSLEEAMLKAVPGKISPITLEAFAAAKRIMGMLKKFAKGTEDMQKKK